MTTTNYFDPLLAAGNSFMANQPLISGTSQTCKIYDVTNQQNFDVNNHHYTNDKSLKFSTGPMNHSVLNPDFNNFQVFCVYNKNIYFYKLIQLYIV